MAVTILDPFDSVISAGGDPTALAINATLNLGSGATASIATMCVLPPDKFYAFVGNAGDTPRSTRVGAIPGAAGASQNIAYARELGYSAASVLLSIGKFIVKPSIVAVAV